VVEVDGNGATAVTWSLAEAVPVSVTLPGITELQLQVPASGGPTPVTLGRPAVRLVPAGMGDRRARRLDLQAEPPGVPVWQGEAVSFAAVVPGTYELAVGAAAAPTAPGELSLLGGAARTTIEVGDTTTFTYAAAARDLLADARQGWAVLTSRKEDQ
jgi:hypothetical protein